MKCKVLTMLFVVMCLLCCMEVFAEKVDLTYEYTKYTGSFRDMAISDDGTIVTVGTNGKMFLITNGNWLEIEQPIFDNFIGIEYGNGAFFVISESSAYVSSDGRNWSCVNSDLNVKENGVFYYNGNNFVFEKENKSTTEFGMTQMKADDICLTKDFITFEKIGEAPLESGLKDDAFSNSKKDEHGEFLIDEAYQIMFGSGTLDTRNVQRRIKLFNNLTYARFPVSADDIEYLGRNNEAYEVFYISDYNLIRATTSDFVEWKTSIVALPDKCEQLYSVDVVYNNGYYIKYQTNKSYNYEYEKNLVYSMDLTNFTVLANIKDEDGNLYVCDELYILKNRNAYKFEESNFVKCFEISNNSERATVKYSNGKYIKWVYENGISIFTSDDGLSWRKVESPNSALTFHCNVDGEAYYDMIWDGTNYIIRSTSYDNGYNPTGEKGRLFICDKSLRLVQEVQFDNCIIEMSYTNGTYNLLTNHDGLLYTSTDLENWESHETDMTIQLSNGRNSIVKKLNEAETGYNISDFQTKAENKGVFKNTAFENYQDGEISVSGEHYLKRNNNMISLSDDGVYWHTIQLPSGVTMPKSVYVENDILCVKTGEVELRYDISKLYNKNHTYVEVDNKILGFETEPVVESDRTLVPLRFIFETMGAEVDWDEKTWSAIVKRKGREIRVSIDDHRAFVDKKEKIMDVPARLINDKTMVPLRFLSEELGFTVDWDEESRTATIRE